MRLQIFKSAEKLKDKVIKKEQTSDRAYFTFKVENPPLVTLYCNGQITYLESCTCKAHSLLGGMPEINMKNLCMYVLAVYKSLGK